ncbi:MAG: hypothetical protein ACRC5T_03365 [Cetobacterium sp.]
MNNKEEAVSDALTVLLEIAENKSEHSGLRIEACREILKYVAS